MTSEVWVTGVGSLTNLGSGFSSLCEAIVRPRASFSQTYPVWMDYEASPLDTYLAHLSTQGQQELAAFESVTVDRVTAIALAVAHQAWQHSGLKNMHEPRKAGVYWGVGMGGVDTIESSYRRLLLDRSLLRPTTVVRIMSNAAAAAIAIKYGLQGANQTYSVACASSAMAIGEAMWAIRSGRLDMAIVGGAEALLLPGVLASWRALRVMATPKHTHDAALPCRPFCRDRTGLVLGEGGAAFVLESKKSALARGATALAEIAGYASTCDAASLVHPSAHGQVYAMQEALIDAQMSADGIRSVNAHATATDTGDVVECAALKQVFGADRIPPVAATKAMHGHLLGASGAVEAALSVATLQTQTTPATLGLNPLDERCIGVNALASPRQEKIDAVLSNSFAFGGSNVSLIFRAIKD